MYSVRKCHFLSSTSHITILELRFVYVLKNKSLVREASRIEMMFAKPLFSPWHGVCRAGDRSIVKLKIRATNFVGYLPEQNDPALDTD